MDCNEAASYIAYRTSEVCAIYPITPSSAMSEWVDEWNSNDRKMIWWKAEAEVFCSWWKLRERSRADKYRLSKPVTKQEEKTIYSDP